MNLGAVTLGALALAIVLTCTSRLNVGLLAIALAWIIGVYVGDSAAARGDERFSRSTCFSRSRASRCCSARRA